MSFDDPDPAVIFFGVVFLCALAWIVAMMAGMEPR